jgi:hypothetical protein
VVGWGEVNCLDPSIDLELAFPGCAAASIANMDDDQFVFAHSMIDKIGIASGREYANAGNVSLTP